MSNLAKLYNMAPSRLHAIYGGESSPRPKEEESSIPPEDMENLSDSPFENKDIENYIKGGESKIRSDNVDRLIAIPDEVIMAESTIQQSSEPIVEAESLIQPVESIEPIVEAESLIQPEIIAPLFDGGDSKNNKEEESPILPDESKIPTENPSDSPLNEVDRLFAKLTGGSQKNHTDSSDYIYELVEPEDLRMWLYDEQSRIAHDDESTKLIRGGDKSEIDEQSNISYMKSSPYYSEFQALIDGLI